MSDSHDSHNGEEDETEVPELEALSDSDEDDQEPTGHIVLRDYYMKPRMLQLYTYLAITNGTLALISNTPPIIYNSRHAVDYLSMHQNADRGGCPSYRGSGFELQRGERYTNMDFIRGQIPESKAFSYRELALSPLRDADADGHMST
ncbi:hypothetical protein C8J57DRAFT_1515531 [Mycena rebaudengoi]|nr:hypothetical protein C8J57DRAFT_1515531 [Mycena rebaudengoi]